MTVNEALKKIVTLAAAGLAWLKVQIKEKSWRRHTALLVITVPLLMQKFGVAPDVIEYISKVIGILTGGIVDDGTIGSVAAGGIFYLYGWAKRKKA